MVVVDDAPNILGTELISLLIKQPIYSKMIFTIQSPLQLEQLENMSGISLDERFSGFVYWHIHKLDKTNECFHQQNGAGWKKMKFPECFKEPEVIKKRGRTTNSTRTEPISRPLIDCPVARAVKSCQKARGVLPEPPTGIPFCLRGHTS